MSPNATLPRPAFWLVAGIFAAIACVRIISTYPILSQFVDEPYHVASGMEWLQKHTYLYERQHPPLSRIAVALPLYLRGLRGNADPHFPDPFGKYPTEDGDAILNSNGQYMTNLGWARAGNLPFFVLSVVFVALLGDLLFDAWTALVAVGLYTLLPPILGSAGVATTDMAPVAGLLAVLYALIIWMEAPTRGRSLIFGIALGFALITKFSLLPFLALSLLLTAGWIAVRHPQIPFLRKIVWRRQIANLSIISVAAFFVIWSAYRFSLAPILTGHGYNPPTWRLGHWLGPVADWMLTAKIPLGEFIGGIGSVAVHNGDGHASFLLGSYRTTGWWYYFPVVLSVKTPLAFLVLTALGIPAMARELWGGDWRKGLLFLFAAGILISCMLARINIGVRHILPIYPLLALIAAWAVKRNVFKLPASVAGRMGGSWFPTWRRVAMAALVVMLVVESAWAHPDYAASFNLLAGKHPERILVNSDLDSGQDLKRLADRLRTLKVDRIELGYFGSTDVSRMGLPPFEELNPRKPVPGWIAVSAFKLELDCAATGDYCWLQDRQPFERIGTSIFLYHLDETGKPLGAYAAGGR